MRVTGLNRPPAVHDGGVLHLRLIIPPDLADDVLAELEASSGAVHIVEYASAADRPGGRLVSCEVVREAANDLVEALQRRGVHRAGAITLEQLDTVVSDAAAQPPRRSRRAPAVTPWCGRNSK